jgi:hypothetical protein
MSKPTNIAFACLIALALAGCAKPSAVKVVKSPVRSVYLTIEYYNGNGPASADDVRVYAHFEQGGDTDRKLILEGEYLELSKLTWVGSNKVLICLSGGITDTFRNEVTLIIGRADRKVHSYLREDCGKTATSGT